MVKIICHRGLWIKKIEQNTKISFKRAIDNKFGIEMDLRDHNGNIIISHDLVNTKKVYYFYKFLNDFSKKINKNHTVLALNIKSDGISEILKKTLKKYSIKNYFVFDMSVPELIKYKKKRIKFFERFSNYEKNLVFNNSSDGIWVDNFFGEYNFPKLKIKKKMCFVSPECHLKKHKKGLFWNKLKKFRTNTNIFLCTDSPFLAKRYFND